MKLTAQPYYLPYLERLATNAKEDITRLRVLTCTPFFRSLYNRLSRLFAILFFFLLFSPIHLCSLFPNGVVAFVAKIASFADGAKPTDEYL